MGTPMKAKQSKESYAMVPSPSRNMTQENFPQLQRNPFSALSQDSEGFITYQLVLLEFGKFSVILQSILQNSNNFYRLLHKGGIKPQRGFISIT